MFSNADKIDHLTASLKEQMRQRRGRRSNFEISNENPPPPFFFFTFNMRLPEVMETLYLMKNFYMKFSYGLPALGFPESEKVDFEN